MKSPILLIILLFTFSLNSQAAPPFPGGADPLPDNTVATCGNIYLISHKVSEPIGPRHRVSGIDTNGRKFSVQVGQDVFENVELYASQDPYFTLNDFVGGSTLQIFWGGYKKAFISFENEPRIEIDCELVSTQESAQCESVAPKTGISLAEYDDLQAPLCCGGANKRYLERVMEAQRVTSMERLKYVEGRRSSGYERLVDKLGETAPEMMVFLEENPDTLMEAALVKIAELLGVNPMSTVAIGSLDLMALIIANQKDKKCDAEVSSN